MIVVKRVCSVLLLWSFILASPAFAAEQILTGVVGKVSPINIKKLDQKENKDKKYKYKTVLKHFSPYILTVTNNNNKPVLLSSDSEVVFVQENEQYVTSISRRDIYRKTRKRDVGRYFSFGIPGAIIGGAITGITLFIGAPIGAAVSVGMYVPVDKAVRNNVRISQDLYVKKDLPIRLEPNKTYEVRILAPKEMSLKSIKITNVSYDLKTMYSVAFPVEFKDNL